MQTHASQEKHGKTPGDIVHRMRQKRHVMKHVRMIGNVWVSQDMSRNTLERLGTYAKDCEASGIKSDKVVGPIWSVRLANCRLRVGVILQVIWCTALDVSRVGFLRQCVLVVQRERVRHEGEDQSKQ